MAIKFNRSQTFATNGTVTAAGLHNLIDGTDIYQALITDQTAMTSVGSLDKLLIADSDLTAADAPRSVTVNELFEDALTLSTYTNVNATNLKYTSATGNYTISTGATITNGTIANLTAGTTTSTAATITTGTIPTLTAGTTTSTAANITNGTVQTLTASTANISQGSAILTQGTIATLNSTTGTIANLSATTSTFLGTITGSTNVVNIGSGQIYKDASGNVGIGTASPSANGLEISKTAGSNSGVKITSGTESAELVVNSTAGFYVSNNSTTLPTMLWTNGAERLRIASAGQIGIGGANYGTSGQVLTSAGASAAPSWQTLGGITMATEVASTSGTAIDFTGIPSGVKRITVIFNAVSLNGTGNYIVQIGSGTIASSGYVSTSNETNQANSTGGAQSTFGFSLKAGTAAELNSGVMTIVNVSSNTWVSSHAGKKSTTNAYFGGGNVSISGTLDRVRITSGVSDTFDSGSINILYES
jgi:hypothetical protein